jgi:hypothetical protein
MTDITVYVSGYFAIALFLVIFYIALVRARLKGFQLIMPPGEPIIAFKELKEDELTEGDYNVLLFKSVGYALFWPFTWGFLVFTYVFVWTIYSLMVLFNYLFKSGSFSKRIFGVK